MSMQKTSALFIGSVAMCCLFTIPQATAQLPSVVQLPSFQTFSYSGSVMVPDAGTASLGSVGRSASGYNRRGMNRSRGLSNAFPQATVTATIIDNAEIDRQILGGTPEEFVRRGRQGGQNAAAVANRPKVLEPTEEGKALVRFARSQYQKGNESTSFEAYLMAIRVLDGRLKDLATVEFRRVFGSAADQSLRMAALRRR